MEPSGCNGWQMRYVENDSAGRKPLLWVASIAAENAMVRRGRRFESVSGITYSRYARSDHLEWQPGQAGIAAEGSQKARTGRCFNRAKRTTRRGRSMLAVQVRRRRVHQKQNPASRTAMAMKMPASVHCRDQKWLAGW
jgi:hypothetical protein